MSESRPVPKWEEYPTPRFFVSVASKGLSQSVSLLFPGRFISVATKGLKARVAVSKGQWSVGRGVRHRWTGVGDRRSNALERWNVGTLLEPDKNLTQKR